MKLYLVEGIATDEQSFSWEKLVIDTELGMLLDEEVFNDPGDYFLDKTIEEYSKNWIDMDINVTYIGEV